MPKAHRILLDRMSGYADEAGAFLRRRRHHRRPFVRLYYASGRAVDHAGDSVGEELIAAAAELIETAGKRPRK